MQVLPEHDSARDESVQRALRYTAEGLDAHGAERLLPARMPAWLGDVLNRVFPGSRTAPMHSTPDPKEGPSALYGWLRQRGATLVAVWSGGEIQVLPMGAAARAGLVGWLQLSLQRLRDFPGVTMGICHPVPNAGPYSGDVMIQIPRWGDAGPAIALFRRDEMGDVNDLLAALAKRGL
jgi:hypothetical protein